MQKCIIITFFLMVFLFPANAQEKLNYQTTEITSYDLYLKKNWVELIEFSTEARKQGIDFYYLQMRTGIAYYSLGKYRTASDWFLKAWENDQSSELLQEYLYISLMYSGRILEARKLESQFSENVKTKLNIKSNRITRMAYEAGYIFNSDFDDLKNNSFSGEVELGSDYGETFLLKDYSFHSLDLSHQLFSNLSLNHNFTYIGINREAIIDWEERYSSDVNIKQFQYFINPVWVIGKKLNVSSSLNLIFGSAETVVGAYDETFNKVFKTSTVNFSDYVFSSSLWYDFGNFSPGVEVNLGDIGQNTFTQASIWMTYYPLSNVSLYVTPKIYFKSGGVEKSFGWNAFGILAGSQLGKLHLSGQYLFGEMQGFVEAGGYLVSNFPGTSDRKITGSAYYPLSKNLNLVFRYINQSVREEYNIYSSGIESNTYNYNYTKHSITGGISWIL